MSLLSNLTSTMRPVGKTSLMSSTALANSLKFIRNKGPNPMICSEMEAILCELGKRKMKSSPRVSRNFKGAYPLPSVRVVEPLNPDTGIKLGSFISQSCIKMTADPVSRTDRSDLLERCALSILCSRQNFTL